MTIGTYDPERNAVQVREGWFLINTCPACPEQYELVDHKGESKAYMRLRWGWFAVRCPDVGGEDVVFEHTFENDDLKGCFDTAEERDEFLTDAVNAVENWWRAEGRPT